MISILINFLGIVLLLIWDVHVENHYTRMLLKLSGTGLCLTADMGTQPGSVHSLGSRGKGSKGSTAKDIQH